MAKKNKKGNNAKKAAPQHKAVDTVEQVPKPSSPEAHLHSLPETPTEETGPVCSLVHPEVSETSASAESGVLTARDVSDIGASDTGHMQDVDLNEQCTDQAAPSLEVDAVQEESDGMHGEDSGGDNQLGYLAQSDEPAAIQDDEPPAPPSPGNHPYAETAFEQSDVQESQLGTPDPTQDASDAPRKSLNDGLLEQRQSAANRDDAGDIAAAGMEQLDLRSASPIPDHLSRSPPSVPPPRGTSGHNNPSLRSPSKSPTLVAIANEAGPSRLSPHQLSSKPASPRPDLNPRSPIKSPRPASTLYIKPTIPVSTPVALTDEDDMPVDDSAPFESIPLQTTPPPHQSVTLPSSPRLHPGSPSTNNKRSSWSGFGVGTGKAERPDFGDGHRGQSEAVDPQSRSSISTLPTSQAQSDRATPTITLLSEKPEAPRLQAPPAHPHPFPIPSPNSPPPTHESKPSHTPSGPSGALGAKGVSTFEKVISHTRPSWLPPKDRAEDETHYHQWEAMMSQARELEKEKRKVEEAKRIEREKRLAINTPKWEEMLDEKTFSADKIRKDPTLRQIWFEGAPTYLRGKAWSLAIGNPLALSKDLYKSCLARSKKAIASGRFPPEILERIETDLDTTLVNLRLFQHGSPLRADLHELICAWVVYRSDTAMGYAPYINLLAALCLLSSPPATAFLSLVNLLSRPVLRAFYTETQDEIEAFYRVFENLQADMFPKIFANCKNLGLRVPESWFRSLLVEQVPFETACRLWDQIVLDGDGYIFRSALAIFGFLEPRLYFPDRDEIESVLEGRNHATQAIIERERERAKLRGETYQEELDGKLSVFGLNEQALFDWLASDGWREARFERLVTREMPD